ncbi:aminodeoxychorismate synthase component I [Oscillatoria amoena NRMC-F 0135]|nr:aminodeoxychorismate synthase component I [Oscillatoria amoena NRMC-F 0135]
MILDDFVRQLNAWGAERVPFLFFIDFEKKRPKAFPLAEVNPAEILYSMNGFSNYRGQRALFNTIDFKKWPLPFSDYAIKYKRVFDRLLYGDSFLTNLTIKTPIEINVTLRDLFTGVQAKYSCWFKEEFLVFSPETFVQIKGRTISAYPMKGTIDAGIPEAESIILNDKKEKAEHITIVDLIRNDLSQVAENVRVPRFRYVDKLKTSAGTLLQVSSEVAGDLAENFNSHLGDMLMKLLPAGSVSGAPKPKTVEIILQAEGEDRGYYTGVFGYFDGKNLDSGVMIRFIEKCDNRYFYRSGGGITTQSDAAAEFQEAINKIYVPVN